MNLSRIALLALTGAALVSSPAVAQENVTVPLSSPGQPVTLKARLISGSITVTVGSGNQVVVESQGGDGRNRGRNRESNVPPGMHRIDIGGGGLDVEEDHNVVTIKTGIPGSRGENILVQVPVNTSVELKTINGDHINVTGINGDLDVECTNGTVNLTDVSGSVVAHTLNGNVEVRMKKVVPGKNMSFTSLNGKVDVTLPADTKARVRLKTNNGSVYSDFDVKMEPDTTRPVIEDGRGQGGKYRIRMDRSVYGSINGGGPEFLFQTLNGDILIHKE